MDLRTNAGYTITDSIHVGDTEFVLGVNNRQPNMFVTWQCMGGNNYFWGHYHDDLLKAKRDLLDRAGEELEYQMNRKAKAETAPKNRIRSVSSNMEMQLRAATPQERLYTYRQSQQITMQTGCIGYLRGDMRKSGTEFWTTWEDCHGDKKTDEFKAEFDNVINALRFTEQSGGIFKSRSALAAYCRAHPESSFQNDRLEYGFRVDTAQYTYLMRVNPREGDNNLYVFCYRREWLDRHMKQAERGIRFIAPDYKEIFRLQDGDMVRITTDAGKSSDHTARYIDDCHVEIGSNLYHICEFAERMERGGNTVIPLRSSLPERCYSTLIDTGAVVILKRGETGFYKTDIPFSGKEEAQALVDEYNKKLGVTKAQAEAMKAGSMFGWACPAADPKNYDDQGQPIRPRHRDRGDAR